MAPTEVRLNLELARSSIPVLRGAAEDYLVSVVVATEVPPHQPERGPAYPDEMRDLSIRAVIDVIRNRVKSPQFPNTAAGVVLEPKQFSAVMRGLSAAALGHRDIFANAFAGEWFADHVARCFAFWREEWPNTVDGACWYFSPIGMRRGGEPEWAKQRMWVPVAGINAAFFKFYR